MCQVRAIRQRPFRARRLSRTVLQLESLEHRNLPAIVWPASLQAIADSAPHEVLDQAFQLPVQWTTGAPATAQEAVAGNIGGGPAGAADVVWYHFALDRAAQVTLGTFSQQQGTVLGLYNTDATDGSDPYDPLGHRLLVQADQAAGGDQDAAPIVRDLAAGDYYVAVSGAGNHYFNPFVAGSGYAGATGAYRLLLSASALQIEPAGSPEVLAIDAAPDPVGTGNGSSFDRSPLLIRVDMSGPVDPSSLNVQVVDVSGSNNVVAGMAFSTVANEVRVSLTQPLGPGTYQVLVSGTDLNGTPIVAGNAPATFQVTGTEGTPNAATGDNTPATAHELNVAGGNLAQVAGAIGDDPTDGVAFNANDVDVYHFQVTGAGNYALTAEAFAGRIGSPLSPALSLFEVVGDNLHLVTLNTGTGNPQTASAGSPIANPLQNDPALYAGLQAGDYYLTVSANGNSRDPFGGDFPFDPNAPLGAAFGGFAFQGGNYVLNVQVQRDNTSPQVVAITGLGPQDLPAPPAQFVVQFSEPVNLLQQAFATQQNTLSSVVIVAADGTTYYPTLLDYNGTSNQATFQLQDRLSPGAYTLHLSGSDPTTAITDVAGNPLLGNDTTGATTDYVVNFMVASAGHGTSYQESDNDELHPQDLGVLAPFDLADGVTITGQFNSEGADFYHFQVLQNRQFTVSLETTDAGALLPDGSWLSIENTNTGQTVLLLPQGLIVDSVSQVNSEGNIAALAFLQAGSDYVLRVDSWASGAAYQVHLANSFLNESPPPLTVGAAPAIRLRLLDNGGNGPPPLVRPPFTPPTAPTTGGPSGGIDTPAHGPIGNPVPASVLLALTASPIGNGTSVTGNHGPAGPDVFDQVFAHAPSPILSDGIVRLAILSLQIGSTTEADNAPVETAKPPAGQTAPSESTTQNMLKNMLFLWNSLPLGPALSTETPIGDDAVGDFDTSILIEPEKPYGRLGVDAPAAALARNSVALFGNRNAGQPKTSELERVLAIGVFFSLWARGMDSTGQGRQAQRIRVARAERLRRA